MIVRFVEIVSCKLLWVESVNVLVSGRYDSREHVQANSKRRATWRVARMTEVDATGTVTAFVEPANKRAKRRAMRRLV